MPDFATPNLPSSDFSKTLAFYEPLGFAESWRDKDWVILERGDIMLEFFFFPEVDPATSGLSCCLRMDNVSAFFEIAISQGVTEGTIGWPRAHRPKRESWGGLVGAIIDADGTLLRLVQEKV